MDFMFYFSYSTNCGIWQQAQPHSNCSKKNILFAQCVRSKVFNSSFLSSRIFYVYQTSAEGKRLTPQKKGRHTNCFCSRLFYALHTVYSLSFVHWWVCWYLSCRPAITCFIIQGFIGSDLGLCFHGRTAKLCECTLQTSLQMDKRIVNQLLFNLWKQFRS